MKKSIIYSLALVLALVGLEACSSDSTDSVVGVNFPSLVEASIETGGTYTLEFAVEGDWKVSVPTETADIFWIQDGEHVRYSQSGSAGNHEVVIACSPKEDFANDAVCEVTMSMGGQSQVIARLKRPKTEYELKVCVAEVDSEGVDFLYNDEGEIIYSIQDCEQVDMVWIDRASSYMQWIQVEANFAWTIGGEIPAWLTPQVTVGEAGLSEGFRLNTNPFYYPAEDTTCTLLFQDHSKSPVETIKELEVKIPGSKDYLSLSLSEQITFNNDGHYMNDGTPVEIGVNATLSSSYAAKVYILSYFERGANTGYSGDSSLTSWVEMTLSDWDMSYGEQGIQSRTLNLKCTANTTGADRRALIVALPASVAAKVKNADNLLKSDFSDLKEEYKPYLASTLTQTDVKEDEKPSLHLMDVALAEQENAFLETLTEGEKYEAYASYGVPVYELTFIGQQNRPNSILYNGNYPLEYEEGVEAWLTYDRSEYSSVVMNVSKMPTIPITGAIFFYREVEQEDTFGKGDLFYILLCTYKDAE